MSLGYRFSSDPSLFTTGDDPAVTENALRGLLNYSFQDNYGQMHQLTLNVDVNNLISLLSKVTDVTIKSEPKILTKDNVEGEFFDGQDIPFIKETSFNSLGNLNQTFDYFAVGIRLKVRPHITSEGNIDLTVNLMLSSTIPGRTLFGGAIVDRRETTTRLVLEDGHTFLMSGILRSEERAIHRGIPGLKDIPLLGELFKHREMANINTELLLFLTPTVVGPNTGRDAIEAAPLQRLESHGISQQTGEATSPVTATDAKEPATK
jgi:type II secretory pathway component GspD/PulD (secretin)